VEEEGGFDDPGEEEIGGAGFDELEDELETRHQMDTDRENNKL
jgi:hypothetical protein